jgi:phage shock protein A
MSSMSEKSAFEAFSRMETRIEDNERRMLANVEIDEEFSGDKLASDFKVLEKGAGAASADSQLLALKQKMGMLPAGAPGSNNRQIGAGGSSDDEIAHAEIEEPPEEQKKS